MARWGTHLGVAFVPSGSLCSVAHAQSPAAPGQGDVFSSNSQQGQPQNGDPCQVEYAQRAEQAYEHEVQVNAQWQKDAIDRRGDQQSAEAARQKRQNGLAQVQKERVDAAKDRDICEARRRLQGRVSSGPVIRNSGTQNPGQGQGTPNQGTPRQGTPGQGTPGLGTPGQGTPATGTPPTSSGAPTRPPLQGRVSNDPEPGGGLPLPASTRQQLLNAAAEMDHVATQAQSYALAGTNRFLKCLAKTLEGDLRFLAQPAYVPAAQMAQSLHESTWKYLTSNPYSNNLAMLQSAVDGLRNAVNDPACAFAQAAPPAGVFRDHPHRRGRPGGARGAERGERRHPGVSRRRGGGG